MNYVFPSCIYWIIYALITPFVQQSEQNLKITLPSKINSTARTTLLSCVVAVLATAISHENYYYLLTEDYWPQILKTAEFDPTQILVVLKLRLFDHVKDDIVMC